jgi:hypothetical protein
VNPHERDETWQLPDPVALARAAARLFVAQVVTLAGFLALGSLLPISSWGIWLPAVAAVVGAWAWARGEGRRRPELLTIEGVRALTLRVAIPLGLGCGSVYLVFSIVRAEQVPHSLPAVLALAAAMALGGGFAGGMLTLCGLDLGRPPESRRPPD